MREIDKTDFGNVFSIYSDWEHHMSLKAAEEGLAAARVWADSVDSPAAAAVCFGYRVLIGGNPDKLICRNAIKDFLQNDVLKNRVEKLDHFFMLFWKEPGWQEALLGILAGNNPYLHDREYYGADLSMNVSLPELPGAYELRAADKSFLEERAWMNRNALMDEMCSERVSVDDFLDHSFGVCAVLGNEIVGWCLSEYNNSNGCEVGIEVLEGHRRKGIGTALTRALMVEARKQGLRRIGWSCFKENLPSSATANKAGLIKLEDYKAIIVRR